MKATHGNLRVLVVSLSLTVWFGLLLPAMTGCATSKSSAEAIADSLAKAQGGEDVFKRQKDAMRVQTANRQLETQRVQEVIERWIEAQGGRRRLEKLQNVQSLVCENEGFSRNYIRTVETADGRYRYDLMVGADFNVSGGYDGQRGWQDGGSWGVGVFPGFRGDPNWSLWCLRATQFEKIFPVRRGLPDEIVDDRACAVLGLTVAGSKSEERWFFEQKTGLLLRVVKRSGAGPEIVATYSDYRPISKIRLPFEVKYSTQGRTSYVYNIVRAEVNASMEQVAFSPAETTCRQAEEVDGLLKRSVEAGVTATGKTKSSVVHATISSATSGIKTALTVYRDASGRVRVEKESAGVGLTVSGYDGKDGWENSEILGYHVLKAGEVSDLFSFSWLGCDPFLRERFPLRAKLNETAIDGRKAVSIRLRNFNGLNGVFHFDKENTRLLRVEMVGNPAIGMQATRVDYSDYRQVGVFTVPFRVVYQNSGSETVITCDSVELDVDTPDSMFRPPAEIN